MVKVPATSLARPDCNWTYPFKFCPVLAENQTIYGAFRSSIPLGAQPRLCILRFSITDFLTSSGIQVNSTNITCNKSWIRLNETGDSRFVLKGIPSGLYILYVAEDLNHAILSATPLLVTAKDLKLHLPSKVNAGEVLKVGVNISGPIGNYTLAALMISCEDFERARLEVSGKGTDQSSARLVLGNGSLQFQGPPSDYRRILTRIFEILPENSAAALQESSRPEAQLYMLTDREWKRGKYLLTCAMYSSGRGIVALNQSEVEVV
jgi:methanogen extracellular protein (TIGR04279 family)